MLEITRSDLPGRLTPDFRAEGVLDESSVGLWWLGQAGFALRYCDTLLLIDPYLSDSLAEKYRGKVFPHERLVPIPVAPEDVVGCEAVLCTHGHTDHMDPPTIRGLQVRNEPVFVVPRAEAARALERGVPPERLRGVNAGDRFNLPGGIRIEAIPSAHETLVTDDAGNHRFLGYIVSVGPVRLYHSGDCVPFAGQVAQLSGKAIDLALLPINGRDEYRRSNGVPGNFTAREAVELCRAAGIGHLIVDHIGMFAFNTVDPAVAAEDLGRYAGPVQWLLPEIGPLYRLRPGVSTVGPSELRSCPN